jgi:hypothetical protein
MTYEHSFQDMKALSCQFHQARSNVEKSNYYLFPNRSKDIKQIYVVQTGSLMQKVIFTSNHNAVSPICFGPLSG